MVDWTSGTADASAAERATGYLIARIPGSPDVLKEIAVADMVFRNSVGDAQFGGNLILSAGVDRIVRIGTESNYWYDVRTRLDDFRIVGADGNICFNILYPSYSFYPGRDNVSNLGVASFRWATVYAATGSINTSDEREKAEIGEVPEAWLDAWGNVEWQRFKFNGGKRWHIGLIAQRVHAVFAAHGLDAFEIGLCCFDQWEEKSEPITEEVERSRKVPKLEMVRVEGTPDEAPLFKPMIVEAEESYTEEVDTGKTRIVQQAGDRWGLRYDECQAIEAAWQRRELARLRDEISALKGES